MLRLSALQRWTRRLIPTSRQQLRSSRANHIAVNHPHLPIPMSPRSTVNLTSYGNFDLVKRFRVELADVEITKWRSRITGLSVVHVDYEGLYPAC